MMEKPYAYELWNHVPKLQTCFELKNFERKRFNEAIDYINDQKKRVEGDANTTVDDLLIFNQGGVCPPIFWCYNNWAEPVIFSRFISKEQPLYAAHSMHNAIKLWKRKFRLHEHFSLKYFDSLTASNPEQIPVLIGNCQGAPIAESMAILYAQKFKTFPLLITLDYFPRRFYQGPTVMLFGSQSRFSPFVNSDIDPISIWQVKMDQYAWGVIDADHGGYFKEPAIEQLQSFIEKAITIFNSGKKFNGAELHCDMN